MESLKPKLKSIVSVSLNRQMVQTEIRPPPLRPSRQHEEKSDAPHVTRDDNPKD